mgnify:CR=1 FL=1
MKNYLFELTKDGEQTVEEVTEQHFYYKVYNEFLEKFHFTNIEENEDFIPYIVKDKAMMILRTDLNIEDLEFDVFDLLGCFV